MNSPVKTPPVTNIYGPVRGLVQGDHNTVTMIFMGGAERTIPYLAPPKPAYALVGRSDLVGRLRAGLIAGDDLALSALHGIPGVGKTALAITLAHDPELLGHLHDGVLWAALGRTPNLLAVLTSWASALDVSPTAVSATDDVAAWAVAVHTAIGLRRMFVVIDDAWDPAAALTLKLGGPHCSHLLTTRIPEVALRFAGQQRVLVSELAEREGLELLALFVPALVAAEPDASRELVALAGGLPLAITLMGNHLRIHDYAGQPRRIAAAVERMRRAEDRLRIADPLSLLARPAGATGTSISLLTAIGISYETLSDPGRTALDGVAVLPPKPSTFAEDAALAVAATATDDIDELVDHGLLEPSGSGRYTLHQTINDFARAHTTDTAAGGRMVDFYTRFTEEHHADYPGLDQELPNILAAMTEARGRHEPRAVFRIARALFPFLDRRGLYSVAEDAMAYVVDEDRGTSPPAERAEALYCLGKAVDHRGDLPRAEGYLRESVTLSRTVPALVALGWVVGMRGRFGEAATAFEEARDIAHAGGDGIGEASGIQGYGWALGLQGRYQESTGALDAGVRLARDSDDPDLTADLLQVQGWMWHMAGDVRHAEASFHECLDIARRIERPDRLIDALQGLGATAARQGRYGEARAYLEEGLAVAERVGHRERMALLCNLGMALRDLGDLAGARERFAAGLALAQRFDHREKVTLLLTRLGDVEARSGAHDAAAEHLTAALALARDLRARERILDVLENRCRAARLAGDLAAADGFLAEGLAMATDPGDIEYRIGLLVEAGELCLARGPGGEPEFAAAYRLATGADRPVLAAIGGFGLSRVAAAAGDLDAARAYAGRSVDALAPTGHHRAAEVVRWLASLGPDG